MSQPEHPWKDLFRQLTQGMSASGSPVLHAIGDQADAADTAADRVDWLPRRPSFVVRPFQLPANYSVNDQACDFVVKIYGSSFYRALDIHSLLSTWLENLIGPRQGGPPSTDARDAILTGTGDLAALSYPYAGLAGKTLDVLGTFPRALTFPVTAFADASAIVIAARNLARSAGLALLFRGNSDDATHTYLEICAVTDPLAAEGASLALDPSTPASACGILGFTGGVNVSASGAPPSTPYRPGYALSDPTEPIRGGNVDAGQWVLSVTVRLYRPVVTIARVPGYVQTVPLETRVSGANGVSPETATNTP